MSRTRIPPEARILVAGSAVSALGTGLVVPLTLIYLHQVRGVKLPVVGALLSMSAAAGLIAILVSGALLDKIGARKVLAAAVAGQALGEAGLAWAHDVPTAIPVLLLAGAGSALTFPAFTTLLAGLSREPAAQQRAFALYFVALNAGVGVGAAVGAALAAVRHPGSFQALFLTSAGCFALFAALVSRLPNVAAPNEPGGEKTGYRDVLGNSGLRVVLIATLVLAFAGVAAVESGLPAFATVEAHASVRVVALSLTVNTAVIVGAQLFVLRLVRALRRSRALTMIGLIWTVAWAVFGASALALPHGLRVACVLAFAALFGLGETVLAPTISPLVNSLADDRTRGRANALSSGAYSVAFVISPAICTGMIAAGLSAVWIALLCAGCIGTAGIGIGLGRRLRPAQDRVDAEPVTAPEPVTS